MAPRPPAAAVDDWQTVDPGDWAEVPDESTKPAAPRVGGQKVLDYANETLSNVPGSALNFAGNIGHAIAHPIDTAENTGKLIVGTAQKMTPGYVTPERLGFSKEAEAAGRGLKERYGSLPAIAETFKTDPVGTAADASAVLGGVSAVTRLGGLGRIARAAGIASDVVNPMTVPLRAAGGAAKLVAQPLVKNALSLPGKSERYGATPAKAVLEETSGFRPSTVRQQAIERVAELSKQLDAVIQQAEQQGLTADLSKARQVIIDQIKRIKAANGLSDDLTPMLDQLTEARPGFQGSTNLAGDRIAPQQPPSNFRDIKHQFGEDYTKFDYAVPLKGSTRKTGNRAYHEMSTELNRVAPGSEPLNQRMQSLIPAAEGAQRAEEAPGIIQTGVNRLTRQTGGLAAPLFAAHIGGPLAAIGTMTVQEALATPTVKMALARLLHSGGKVASSPTTRRALNTGGVAGQLDALPKYAKGGIIKNPTLLSDLKTGKPTGIMAEAGPEEIKPLSKPDLSTELNELSARSRRAVRIPSGTFPREIPDGMTTHVDSSTGDKIVFNPNLIGIHDIKTAVAMKRLTPLLGKTHSPSAMSSTKHIMKQSRKTARRITKSSL